MAFRHFEAATHAIAYNKFRPSPPEQLVKKVIDFLKSKYTGPLIQVVDVGCGAGQSTKVWAPFFERVIGFDPSRSQVLEAEQNNTSPNIKYLCGSAEIIDALNSSTQLITASQSCHWFDLPKFYAEVERILVPGGVLAMFGYCLPRPQYGEKYQELCGLVDKFYTVTLGSYLFPANHRILNRYKGDKYNETPFIMKRDESICSETNATLSDLVGYISSLSAFQHYLQKEGEQKANRILHLFENEFKETINVSEASHEIPIKIHHEYFLLLGAKSPLERSL